MQSSELAALRGQFPYFAAADQLRAAGAEFPIYLDSAATAQRPQQVLDAENSFIINHNAAVHRGTSAAVGEATFAFENAREQVAAFLGCGSSHTLVWQAGATDALNTIAFGVSEATAAKALGQPVLGVNGSDFFALEPSDEILVTAAEHHANLIPWQRLATRTGARLVVVPVTETGTWSLPAFKERLNPRTRIVTFTHVSNVTGWRAPVAEVVAAVKELAHPQAITVLDACQSVPHLPFNVAELDVDFAVFSGHKMLGPNGIGGLLGRTELLNLLPPARTGGSAITTVTADAAEFLPAPHRFEPGTQAVSQAVGLAAAAAFLSEFGMSKAAAYEHELVGELLEGIASLGQSVKLLGPADPAERAALSAITVAGVHPHDVGQVLDTQQVLVRVGHHCAQPLHRALGISASVRASVHLTTSSDEIAAFIAGIKETQRYFGVK